MKSLLLLAALIAAPAAEPTCEARREDIALMFSDFASSGELESPPAGTGIRGVAVLFAGSDVADKDGSIVSRDGRIISRPLRQIADRLACSGYATVRYNKRYVSGATEVDRPKFDAMTGADLAADGRVAVAYARSRPELARVPLALVGWSQGTTVAMEVAATEPDIGAVVLMAPVTASPAANAQGQYARVGKPYLQQFSHDGALDAAAIAQADAGPAGLLAHIFVGMFRGFAPGERINPLLDTNKDGRISFAEADPIIASWYADGPDGGLGMDATGRALKGVDAAFSPATPPLLIVQGLNDGNVDPVATRAFSGRADTQGRVTLIEYPGLGHSLGPALSATQDGLLPTAREPLDDIVQWLDRTLVGGEARNHRN